MSASPPALLDSSFLIALERETLSGEMGPARRFLPSLRGRSLVVSIVTVAEVLEGSRDEEATMKSLRLLTIQGLHLTHSRRCALLQRGSHRRMGENDAWLVTTAEILGADVVGADRSAFERLGQRYLRFQ